MSNPPMVSRRRIEGLKQLAADCGLSAEDARAFGKLTKTSTWEELLKSHGLEYEPKPEISHNNVATASQEINHQIDFFQWVDFWAIYRAHSGKCGPVCAAVEPMATNSKPHSPPGKNHNSNRSKVNGTHEQDFQK
jgi:hypothetical protein